jgi:hypothetical protein
MTDANPPPDTTRLGRPRKGLNRLKTLDDLDGRTNSARRARQLVADIESDLGGDLTASKRELVTRAAVLGAYLQSCEVAWLGGEAVDTAAWFSAIDRQRRLLEVLGLERKARDVSLTDYLARKERS